MKPLAAGASATVATPATSANLGPGFDCLGLALDLWDTYTAVASDEPGVRVRSSGEGADVLPCDATHLVARSLLVGLAEAGVDPVGLDLTCNNAIPHRRGLGSSSAAIVGGLRLAQALVADPRQISDRRLLELANDIEGHPDNVAAAALGGATVAWLDDDGAGRAAGFPVHPDVVVTVLIPASQTETEAARGLLPSEIPYRDAVFNIGRTALLVHALSADPAALFTATADRLHQDYRAGAYPASIAAVRHLRAAGVAAAISGAGPTVIAFAPVEALAGLDVSGFALTPLAVSPAGAAAVTGRNA